LISDSAMYSNVKEKRTVDPSPVYVFSVIAIVYLE